MTKNNPPAVLQRYEALKKQMKKGRFSESATDLIGAIYEESLNVLSGSERIELKSKVPNKSYIAFENASRFSRAINADLYDPDVTKWARLSAFIKDNKAISDAFPSRVVNSILYSVAISFCASIDLIKQRDQKTPGTFFEYLIAHFFTWCAGVEPQNSIQVLSLDGENTKLPTDFIFNLGKDKPKFHMPVKTSSRERAIMLWAHQRLLDGVFGTQRFMGTPVLLAETKTDTKKREVVEICLPEQWRLYQLYVSKLTRVYYLDMPAAYANLGNKFPPLDVRPFGDFFFEWENLRPN